ncbi:MAG: DUF4861 family protein [Paludibacteraceae bacterium]|nr:DUF4861 family protein [Paludibacteraceae bacterium]
MASRFYNTLFLILLVALQACAPADGGKRVNAQMFLKAPIGEEGVVECYAEGKHYGIRAVTCQTFLPGDDSFHQMHHHGVALESEVMAYRIYFDKRQTVDVYAKRTPRLELAGSLWYPDDAQLARGFGDDVLKVGNTIGVGSVRPWDKEKQKLANTDKFASRTQRIVSVSDTAATVEVEIKQLQTEGKTVDMLTRYTILAGHRDMVCQLFLSDSLTSLVTGVQTIGNGETISTKQLKDNERHYGVLLASWGTDWPVNDTVKYPKETLGIAVAVPYGFAGGIEKPQGQTLVYLVPLKNCMAEMPDGYSYYADFHLTAVSLKENNPPAKNAYEFFDYAREWETELVK